ncbi:uncharacterized protein BYT42DRAFT_576118 [Radiomyces spectabilis]|uniref:uncharacterized protein n=1 Tax=Radiomyces spectabilis TaxID=64574 RepID=UPI00221E4EB8|nr:uncharacterized protein BYT42DRAFT_576118 [Radiomyces spectabilis]KAI8374368.1 hypothetical protein BYT42DRAFT_576118 [Radiomyces spectabilis]
MSSSTNYHIPAIAAVAGIALAASGYVMSTSSSDSKKRRRRIKTKIMREHDGNYILGLKNTGNSCFINSVLQAFATLTSLRSYLAERVDEQGDDSGFAAVPPDEFILQSVACALYATIEMLNRPLMKPRSITPDDVVHALQRKTNAIISRDQQDAHELFQIISSALTSEEEQQYRNAPHSILDANMLRNLVTEPHNGSSAANLDNFETASMSSIGTIGSMWSSFSVSTTGANLHHRPRRPRNPFTGLAASKISCTKCGYTAPIRHHTFDNISLILPLLLSCTLEDCLSNYTKVDVLTDYQCRKCSLVATLNKLVQQLNGLKSSGRDKDDAARKSLETDIYRLQDAIRFNIEASLPGVSLINPDTNPRTTKQTMFANPPKSLCLHLSRSIYHPSGYVQKNTCNIRFPEYLDIAPYTTNGFLNTNDPKAAMNSPPPSNIIPQTRTSRTSLVYLRNMAGGHRFVHGRDGLNVALMNKEEDHQPIQNALPSLITQVSRPVMYRLNAVIVHYGSHESGHFVTYRRKKLPTGHEVRDPLDNGLKKKERSKFWRCSDEIIDEVDIEDVLKSEAYMLFYERET